jgi:hypothetical protein
MRPISILVLALVLLPVPTAVAGGGKHLGVAPGQIVNLFSILTPCPNQPGSYAFNGRVLPDGTKQAFTIPDGMALVITDVTWQQAGVPASKFWSINLETDQGLAIFLGSTLADSSGFVAGSEHLTSGIVVKAGRTVCIGASSGIPFAEVLGYLVRMR